MLSLRRMADGIIQRVDMKQSIEYRSAKWVEENLPGAAGYDSRVVRKLLKRVYRSAPTERAALHHGSQLEQQIAVYTIYVGENAGGRDAEYSLLWLKAFGAQ